MKEGHRRVLDCLTGKAPHGGFAERLKALIEIADDSDRTKIRNEFPDDVDAVETLEREGIDAFEELLDDPTDPDLIRFAKGFRDDFNR